MTPTAVIDLIETYRKYGWEPRRLLLAHPTMQLVDASSFGIPVHRSSIDAIWFSRPKQPDKTPWELRHLSETPFALVEHLDEESADFEQQISEAERRMAESIHARKPA
jgi:hypothetical protein